MTSTTVTLTVVPAALPAGAAAVSAFYVYQDGVKVRTLGATELNPTITGLTAGVLYQFSVTAYNGQESTRSADLAVSTTSAGVPTTPTNLAWSSKAATSATLSWTASTSPAPDTDPVQGYRVRQVGGGILVDNITGTSTTVTGLVDGEQVRVVAFNTAGVSVASATATFTAPVSGTGVTPLRAGKVAATYSVAMPKMVGTYSDNAANIAALLDIGARQWRSSFQPDLANYRTRTADLAAAGLRNIARLGSATTASTTAAGQDTPLQLINKMIQYFGTVAGTFPNRKVEDTFCMIEGINEPNNDSVAFIADTNAFTKATWDAYQGNTQMVASGIKVTGPAFARIVGTGAEGPTLLDQSTRMAAAAEAIHGQTGKGLGPWVHLGVTHIYPKGVSPSSDYKYFMDNCASILYPGLQNSTTEGGYSTDMRNTTFGNRTPEDVEGIYADRHICEHILRNSLYFNRHELWDDVVPAGSTDQHLMRESSFGLLRADGTKKPSYATTKNFLALFKDENATTLRPTLSGFTLTALNFTLSPTAGAAGSTTNTLRSLLFQHSDGSYRLVLWRDEDVTWSTTAPYPITLKAALNVTVTLPSAKTVTEYQPSLQAAATVAAASKTSHTVALKDYLTVLKIV